MRDIAESSHARGYDGPSQMGAVDEFFEEAAEVTELFDRESRGSFRWSVAAAGAAIGHAGSRER